MCFLGWYRAINSSGFCSRLLVFEDNLLSFCKSTVLWHHTHTNTPPTPQARVQSFGTMHTQTPTPPHPHPHTKEVWKSLAWYLIKQGLPRTLFLAAYCFHSHISCLISTGFFPLDRKSVSCGMESHKVLNFSFSSSCLPVSPTFLPRPHYLPC